MAFTKEEFDKFQNNVNEYAAVLRKNKFDENIVNDFLLESYLTLEVELEEQGLLIGEGLGDVFSSGTGALVDTLKGTMASWFLGKLGIKEGPLQIALRSLVETTDLSDIKAYMKGDSKEVCSRLSTQVAITSFTTIGHVIAERLGLEVNGFMYRMITNALLSGETDEGLSGVMKKWLDNNACGWLSRKWSAGWSSDVIKPIKSSDITSAISKSMAIPSASAAKIARPSVAVPSSVSRAAIPAPDASFRAARASVGRLEEDFQDRMKRRLKRQIKKLLDGGRKDLVKYGKPWNQGRQQYSNALAEEVEETSNDKNQ